MNRLADVIVPFGLRIACRRASWPTSRSPCSVNATTDGVVRPPSALGMTVGSPPSSTAIQLLVVPRSMPIVFAIPKLPFLVGLLRKSKPEFIKSLAGALALFGLLAATPAGASRPAPLRLVRIGVDTTAIPGAQHATVVEPDAVAAGSRVVSTFQVGRLFGGSATAIGFATSADAGRTWRSGFVPGAPGGVGRIKSDPVVAYDALHARWLI